MANKNDGLNKAFHLTLHNHSKADSVWNVESCHNNQIKHKVGSV